MMNFFPSPRVARNRSKNKCTSVTIKVTPSSHEEDCPQAHVSLSVLLLHAHIAIDNVKLKVHESFSKGNALHSYHNSPCNKQYSSTTQLGKGSVIPAFRAVGEELLLFHYLRTHLELNSGLLLNTHGQFSSMLSTL